MFLYIRLICRRLLIVTFILLIVNNYQGQTQNKEFLEQKISLSIKTGNLFQICGGLVYDGIPIGFEGVTGFDMKSPQAIQIKDGSLKEILDSIVKQDSRYTWEIRDEVVNIYPIRSRDEEIEILLARKIKTFSLKKEMGRIGAGSVIYDLDEISTLLNSKQIRLSIFTRTNLYVDDATTDIDISNTDLRGILNKIIYDSGDSKFWSINRTKDGAIFLVF